MIEELVINDITWPFVLGVLIATALVGALVIWKGK